MLQNLLCGIQLTVKSHLLGKKSWNVYNQDNIQKVKRDEAAAKAVEEAEEQRMQEIDAERRMQVLRGETPTPIPDPEDKVEDARRESRPNGSGRDRKKRKKSGENDTDFEMRLAHEQTLCLNADKKLLLRNPIDAPLVDKSGHLDLFPREASPKGKTEKNAEAEKELAKKKKEYEDQYTMRFSNAAGFKQALENPWYSKANGTEPASKDSTPGKNVWGDEDPRRKQREAARIVSSDPLAMMRQGAKQVRQVELERKLWREEKEREIRGLEEEERQKKARSRKRRYEDDEANELEGFSLDSAQPSTSRRSDDGSERRHRHTNRDKKSHRRSRHSDEREGRHSHRHKHKDRHRE